MTGKYQTPMYRAPKTYKDPVERSCWVACPSCFRCEKKGTTACPLPNSCSGRPDKLGIREPHPDDFCDCKNGVMRWITKEGRLIVRRYQSSPFTNNIMTDAETEDERDWNAYVREKREQFDDPTYDPVRIVDV